MKLALGGRGAVAGRRLGALEGATSPPFQCIPVCPFPLPQVLFILAWFHAILQERRNYIPQGWVKFHEFSTADLRCAADIIVANCSKDLPDWPTLYGLFENAIYGGRMDSNADVRILRTYLSGMRGPAGVRHRPRALPCAGGSGPHKQQNNKNAGQKCGNGPNLNKQRRPEIQENGPK